MADLKQLRYFTVLADTLHFGNAAERLNIVQPALSMQIKALEEELGTRLFNRDRHRVSLTRAGETLRSEAEEILTRMQGALDLTRRAGRGETGHLRIGLSASAIASGIAAEIIRRYRIYRPNISIAMTEVHPLAQPRALLDKSFDIVLGLPAAFEAHSGEVRGIWLSTYPIELVVSEQHPLARIDAVSAKDLTDQTFVGLSDEDEHASSYLTRSTLGFEPRSTLRARSQMMMMAMVEANIGVAVVSAALRRTAAPTVRFLKIEGAEKAFDLYLFRREKEEEAAVIDFCQHVLSDVAL